MAPICNTMIPNLNPQKLASEKELHESLIVFSKEGWTGYDLIKDEKGSNKKKTATLYIERIKDEKIENPRIIEFYVKEIPKLIKELKYEEQTKFYNFLTEKLGPKLLTEESIKAIADEKDSFTEFLLELLKLEKNPEVKINLFKHNRKINSGNMLSYCASKFSPKVLKILLEILKVGMSDEKNSKILRELKEIVQKSIVENNGNQNAIRILTEFLINN